MSSLVSPQAVGQSLPRLDGRAKVTGSATYAYEHTPEGAAYLHPLQASIAAGRVTGIDTSDAEAVDGVLAVLTHDNAARLADTSDGELAVLQTDRVAFRGQLIGGVIARTPEIARHAASVVRVGYEQWPHRTALPSEQTELYRPDQVNPTFETDTDEGDIDVAISAAPVTVDETYTTPMEHNNPMEPHSCVAVWGADQRRLTVYDSTQGAHSVRSTLAPIFGLEADQVRVVSPHVGGGFGSKGLPHAHNVLAVLAAQLVPGTPVKLALTRQQMFSLVGHRTPTIQRVRLAANASGELTAIAHDATEHTATIKEFAEQTTVPTRTMYAAPNRRTSHRLAALDVPVPSWMRAPGEAPGMVAPEIAMDELAGACGMDPVELRVRNEPSVDPETGKPWSSRNLVACLREGAHRFGWDARATPAGTRQEGRWLVGMGVASSTYPAFAFPGSVARIRYPGTGDYVVEIGAADIGTGTRTALTQIAADALDCPVANIQLYVGDTDLPMATVAGGSSGISSWGSTIIATAREFRQQHGEQPASGAASSAEFPKNPDVKNYAIRSFGAQFAEAHVHADTGEIRVPRMLGVFSVGRIINPITARSQFIGGMTMGLSMALHEHSVLDHNAGHVVNHDFAQYHIPTHADVDDIDVTWLDEIDSHANPMGSKGIGEIGIVGSPAAVVNAVYNASGVRVRQLPLTPDKLLRTDT